MARTSTKSPEAVYGPYCERGGFRVIYVDPDGGRASYFFEDEGQAKQEVAKLKRTIGRTPRVTVDEALNSYEVYMRDDKGNKVNSVAQTMIRLRRFFTDVAQALADLDEEVCASYYETLRTSPGKHGKPVSVDYHRNVLAESRSFLKWCMTKKKWIPNNPLADVEGIGKRNHGKEQHRIDESRTWFSTAVKYADEGEDGAVAAMMTLLMNLRCSEITERVVRDVDDRGRVLWIPDSKTKAGKRALVVPEILQPYILELVEGKRPDDLLFGYHDRAWPRKWVQRICREAGVKVVTAHGQRGLHSTIALEAGITPEVVARAMGHESFRVTAKSYAKPEALANARQERVGRVLEGHRGDERSRAENAAA